MAYSPLEEPDDDSGLSTFFATQHSIGSATRTFIQALPNTDLRLKCPIEVVITLDEGISRVIRDFVEIAQIGCVGEEIVIDDVRVLTLADEIADEARADETGSAGNQNLHCFLKMDAEDWIAACEISSEFPSN